MKCAWTSHSQSLSCYVMLYSHSFQYTHLALIACFSSLHYSSMELCAYLSVIRARATRYVLIWKKQPENNVHARTDIVVPMPKKYKIVHIKQVDWESWMSEKMFAKYYNQSGNMCWNMAIRRRILCSECEAKRMIIGGSWMWSCLFVCIYVLNAYL